MIDLDPAILDQESIRKKRRKKMFLIASVPITILVLASILFLRPGIFDAIFSMRFNQNDAGGAISISQFHKSINIIEPYIAYYDAGTAYIKGKDGKNAENELQESLRNNPPKDMICQIRVNLSYSIELQADDAKNRSDYDNALKLYNKAEGVLYDDDCASKQSGKKSKDSKAEEATERISKKRNAAVALLNGAEEYGDDDNGGDNPNNIEISEDEIKDLRQKLQDGSSVRGEVYGRQRGLDFSTNHW